MRPYLRAFSVIGMIAACSALMFMPARGQTTTTQVKTTTAHLAETRDAAAAAQAPATSPLANTTTSTLTSLAITTFVDGNGQMTAGMVVDLYKIGGTNGKLYLVNATGVGVTNGTTGNVYTGLGLRYSVFHTPAGFTLDAIVAWKGIDLNTVQIPHGWGNAIVGIKFGFPIGSP